jgi:hypothetical protein
MSFDMALDQPHPLDQWSVWFKAELAPSDLDAPGVLAFMYYFADMGILEPVDESRWKLCNIDNKQSSGQLRDSIRDHLEGLSQTEEGFAISYFLGQRPKVSSRPLRYSQKQKPHTIPDEGKIPNREKASDLSNLQIVKKVGRQLRPFLDFEKETVARLLGTHTEQKEARIIFNYILRHTQAKAEPKEWEQISRKRHK